MQKRKRTFLKGIVLLVLIAATYTFLKVNKQHTNSAAVKTDVSISAGKLFADFSADENAANKIYLNKIIEVNGTIASVTQQSAQYVILLNTNAGGGINCLMMDDAQKLAQLKPKDDITIKGKCSGFLMDVNLVDCVLIK